MNQNDFRLKAYEKNSEAPKILRNSTDSDGVSVAKIKPFMPKKLASEPKSPQKSEKNISQKEFSLSEKKAEEQKKWENHKKNEREPSASSKTPSATLDDATSLLKSGGLLKVPAKPQEDGKDNVYRRVAKFLLLVGEDEAAKILPHLSEKQIEKIIPEIASIRTVSQEEAAVILEEFNLLIEKSRQSGGVETAREMLEKAYGKKRAEEMLRKAMPLEGKQPFDYLNDADSERIYQLLKDENVGVQSMVLTHLNPKKSAEVINQMTDDEKKEVILRLAKTEKISPEIIRRVDQAMHEKSLNMTVEKAENIDGRNALAQILKKMDAGAEQEIITYLSEDDPDLGQDLRNRLFTIDDVIKADDRFVQEKLRSMSDSDLAYLIAGKNDDFREKILDNMSRTRRAEIEEQEVLLKPMRKSDIERITGEFFSIMRRAYDEGHLIIKGRNDDVYV